MAAFAAVLLIAPSAQAGLVEFQIDTSLSSLGFVERITDPALGGETLVFHRTGTSYTLGDPNLAPGVALPGSYSYLASSTSAWGNIYANWNPAASLQFTSQSRVNYNTNADNQGFGPGNLLPFENSSGNIQAPPGGIPAPRTFGFEISGRFNGPGFGYASLYNTWQTFGTLNTSTGQVAGDGGPALPFIGGNNYIAAPSGTSAQTLAMMDGWEDVYSLIVDKIQLNEAGPGDTPFPSPFVGNTVFFDGVTLSIPLNFHLNFTDDGTTYDIDTFGVLVAHPVVPEPSSVLLAGLGVVGLASYAWRARKRRA